MRHFQAREAMRLCPPKKSKRRPRKRGSIPRRQGGVFVDYVQALLTGKPGPMAVPSRIRAVGRAALKRNAATRQMASMARKAFRKGVRKKIKKSSIFNLDKNGRH